MSANSTGASQLGAPIEHSIVPAMQSPPCSLRSLGIFVICKAAPMHVPKPLTPFVVDPSVSNTADALMPWQLQSCSCDPSKHLASIHVPNERHPRCFKCVKPRRSQLLPRTQSVSPSPPVVPAPELPSALQPLGSQQRYKIKVSRVETMVTIPEGSTTLKGFPKLSPPVLPRESLAKAPSLDQPREDTCAKKAPRKASGTCWCLTVLLQSKLFACKLTRTLHCYRACWFFCFRSHR